jgi:hypothetical protein
LASPARFKTDIVQLAAARQIFLPGWELVEFHDLGKDVCILCPGELARSVGGHGNPQFLE